MERGYYLCIHVFAIHVTGMLEELQEHVESIDMANGKIHSFQDLSITPSWPFRCTSCDDIGFCIFLSEG